MYGETKRSTLVRVPDDLENGAADDGTVEPVERRAKVETRTDCIQFEQHFADEQAQEDELGVVWESSNEESRLKAIEERARLWLLTEKIGQPSFLAVVLDRNTGSVEKDKYYHNPVEELRFDDAACGLAKAFFAAPKAFAKAFVFDFGMQVAGPCKAWPSEEREREGKEQIKIRFLNLG